MHVAPASSADVPDEDSVRLVVLGPQYHHSSKTETSPARAAAAEILERRGTSPRRNRNMVVFLAPDRTRLDDLEAAIRQFLAWSSIEAESGDAEPERLLPQAGAGEAQAGRRDRQAAHPRDIRLASGARAA